MQFDLHFLLKNRIMRKTVAETAITFDLIDLGSSSWLLYVLQSSHNRIIQELWSSQKNVVFFVRGQGNIIMGHVVIKNGVKNN